MTANLNMNIFICNQYYTTYKNINSLEDLLNAFQNVEDIPVCKGGPLIRDYQNVGPRCAYKDLQTKRWRHNQCTLGANGSICIYCSKLSNTLDKHVNMRKRKKIKEQLILSSPTKKRKLEISRKARRVQAQAYRRQQIYTNKLKQDMNLLKDEMSHVKNTTLEKLLTDKQINETQVIKKKKSSYEKEEQLIKFF